ncbi:MAG: hypothetical protein JST39_06500, partial [Bacteroidetes bacterium]|nr:hypothetical protein [Bacteroidota bacterium]
MKKTSPLIPLLVAVSCSLGVKAQDSTALDLGGVRLQKQFTQSITIKGEALEKMPFANLSDALSAWAYGVYSNDATLTYIVDGNIVADVNAWSIYDIEEVVLPQTALTQLSGNAGQQQLVLITTKRGKAKQGLSLQLAGSSALVNTDYNRLTGMNNYKSETNLFHQYQASAVYSQKNWQAGLSAGWLRDVAPAVKSDSSNTLSPMHINRFRINAWVQARVDGHSTLYINLGTTPENTGFHYKRRYGTTNIESTGSGKEILFNPYARLQTFFGKGWENNFTASWQIFRGKDNATDLSATGSPAVTTTRVNVYDSARNNTLVLRDNISKTFHARNWTITPAVYLQYTHLKIAVYSITTMTTMAGSGLGGQNVTNTSASWVDGKGHLFTGAPSVGFAYRNILSFGGGAQIYLPPSGTEQMKQAIFPFAQLSLDLLKLHNSATSSSLLLTGAYAVNYNYNFQSSVLNNLTGTDFLKSNTGSSPGAGLGGVNYGSGGGGAITPVYVPVSELYARHEAWSAGLTFRKPAQRLEMSYYYERRVFTAPVLAPIPYGTGFLYVSTYPRMTANTHQLRVIGKPLKTASVEWQTGITATRMDISGPFPPYPYKGTVTG